MAGNVRLIPVVYPDRRGDVAAFGDVYQPLIRMTYYLREERPRRRYLPDREPANRRCALCGQSEPAVTFKEHAHIIAAGLGNRTWVSREECDACNHRFSSHEDELANMLSASRIIGRVRSRTGTAKVKAPGGLGSIGGGAFHEPLMVNIHADDPSVRIDWRDEKTMKLTFPQPGYRPFLAIRSLVRACWLGMTADQRDRHPYLLDVITGALDPESNEYVDVMVFDGLYSHVMLEAWEPRPDRADAVAPFVFRLCFVDRVLIWTSPDPATRLHVPSQLPPIPLAVDAGSARGKLHRGPSSASVDSGSVTHTIACAERVRGGVETPAATKPKPLRLEADARLELQTSVGTSVIGRTLQTIYDLDAVDGRMTLRFAGYDLAGSISIHSHGNDFDVSAGLQMAGHTTAQCRETHDFLRAMLNTGGKLRAQTETGTLTFPVERSQRPYVDPDVDRFLDDLQAIEREFDVAFVVPNAVTDDDARLVRFLSTAVRDHRVITGKGELSITLSPAADESSVQALASGRDIALDADEEFVLFGCRLARLQHKATFVSPKLIEPKVDEIHRQLRQGQEVAVQLSVAAIVHTFPLWEPRAA
jgi:hypothetical protein